MVVAYASARAAKNKADEVRKAKKEAARAANPNLNMPAARSRSSSAEGESTKCPFDLCLASFKSIDALKGHYLRGPCPITDLSKRQKSPATDTTAPQSALMMRWSAAYAAKIQARTAPTTTTTPPPTKVARKRTAPPAVPTLQQQPSVPNTTVNTSNAPMTNQNAMPASHLTPNIDHQNVDSFIVGGWEPKETKEDPPGPPGPQ